MFGDCSRLLQGTLLVGSAAARVLVQLLVDMVLAAMLVAVTAFPHSRCAVSAAV